MVVLLVLALLVVSAAATSCGSNANPLSRLRWSDADPAWSSGGRRIAFDRVGQGQWLRAIFVTAAAGGRARRLTPLGTDARSPSWSPNGHEVLFVSNLVTKLGVYSDDAELTVINANGKSERLLDQTFACSDSSWSPDGRWIAYDAGDCSGMQGGSTDLELISPKGTDWRPIPSSHGAVAFGWSPDAKKLAFACSNNNLCVFSLRTGLVRSLTHYPPTGAAIISVAWSPDGKRIAYISGTGGSYQPDYHSWVIDASGHNNHRLPLAQEDGGAVFLWLPHHPDTLIASLGLDSPVYLVRGDGREKRVLRADSPGSDDPVPSPNGHELLWVRWQISLNRTKSAIFLATLHGRARQLTQTTAGPSGVGRARRTGLTP
jgi:Tol biopolymer transport system component